MYKQLAIGLIALGGLALCPVVRPAWGQGQVSGGGFGSSPSGTQGLFGSRNLGSSFSSGSSNFRGGGSVAGATTQADTTAGQITGSERFIRGNRQQGQFVGSDPSDLPAFFSGLSSLGASTGMGISAPPSSRSNEGNRDASGRGSSWSYRITRSVAFDYPARTPVQITEALTNQIRRAFQIESLPTVKVEVVGETAILHGEVATSHDRDLAEQLARLEAGIWAVQNELTVAEIPPPPSIPTPR